MSAAERPSREYVLGSKAQELARLDAQAASIEPATRLILQAAGLGSGARVLDLGTGLGHVARLVSQLIGPTGSVVGLDQSADALAEARRRAEDAGEICISYVAGDVTSWRDAEAFDAIVGRLLLFHVADPVNVVRHHLGNLRPNGQFVAIDFDVGGARCEPPVALASQALDWIREAFVAAGASPAIGARLGMILEEAGLDDVKTFGIQPYWPPHSPAGPALLAGVVRSLMGAITAHGIATPEQIGVDTLQQRIADALTRGNAVLLPPTVAGAWGIRRNA